MHHAGRRDVLSVGTCVYLQTRLLEEYLASFSPGGERWWRWWDGVVEDHGTLKVTVPALDLPLAWDELHWLLRAAGADEVYEAGWEEYEASQGD